MEGERSEKIEANNKTTAMPFSPPPSLLKPLSLHSRFPPSHLAGPPLSASVPSRCIFPAVAQSFFLALCLALLVDVSSFVSLRQPQSSGRPLCSLFLFLSLSCITIHA